MRWRGVGFVVFTEREILRIVSVVDPASVFLNHQNVCGDLVDEETVVRDEQHGTGKFAQRPFQTVPGPQVEVIGGFVKNQQVGIEC